MSDFTNDIRAGDVINIEGFIPIKLKTLFWDIAVNLAIDAIRTTQHGVFACKLEKAGKKVWYQDNHTMLYLGDQLGVFSTEPPKPVLHPLSDYDTDKGRIMSIYRMNPAYFGRPLSPADLKLLVDGATTIVQQAQDYDVGQNLNILVNTIAGYPWSYKLNWFDADKSPSEDLTKRNRLVCSVAVAAIIAYWRHETYKATGEDIPQPWKRLNPEAWTKEQIDSFPGHWDINATFPANYATTDTNFQNEFIHVGHYRQGKRIA